MRFKKLLILIFVFILAVSGCSKGPSQSEENAEENEPVLTVVSLEPFITPIPSCASTKTDLFIVHHLYEGLFTYDQTGQLVNGLSVSEKSNDTNTVWTFEIDPESLWSDGKHVSADDFVYSVEYALSADKISADSSVLLLSIENVGNYLAGNCGLDEIGITATSENTLEIRFNAPVAHISTVMSQPVFFPMRRDKASVYTSDPGTVITDLPCNGSYVIAEYAEDRFYFEENPKHSSIVPLKNKSFVLDIRKAIADVSFTEKKDYLVLLQQPIMFQSDDFRLESVAGFGTTFLRFNFETPEYLNQDLRDILQLSLRNQDIVSQLGVPYYPAEGFLSTAFTSDNNVSGFRKNYSPCNVSETAHANNILVAQTMLSESRGSSLPLTLVYNREDPLQKALAPVLHDMWKSSLNIEVSTIGLNRFDYQDHIENSDYSLILETETLNLDMPHMMLDSFRSDSMSNFGHYSSIRYDTCYQNCIKASAFQDYNDFCMQADTILFEDAAVIPLIYQTHFFIVSSAFSSYTLLPNGLALIN